MTEPTAEELNEQIEILITDAQASADEMEELFTELEKTS